MATSQVVLYFDKPEDAVQFTVAASSVLAEDAPADAQLLKVAQEIGKASRIRTESSNSKLDDLHDREEQCA
jgi:hypothetical protein